MTNSDADVQMLARELVTAVDDSPKKDCMSVTSRLNTLVATTIRGDLSPDNFRPRGTGNYGESKFSPGNPRGAQFTY